MKAPLSAKFALALCSCLLALALAECAVRLGGRSDADGNFFFRQTRVRPYQPPVRAAEHLLRASQAAEATAIIYNSELGWVPRPNFRGTNDAGFFSSSAKLEETRPEGRLRIALFGGSFTQNSFELGWWREMEKALRGAGVDVEVLNFGVSAYGMDQAYLRWKLQAAKYHADIVLFGFVAPNAGENVNMIRLLQDSSSGIPFLKPRFAKTHDDLALINLPTPKPEEIPHLLSHLDRWPFLRQEYFYRAGDYRMRWWRRSRLLAYAESKLRAVRTRKAAAALYQMNEEPAQVSLRIVRHFQEDVQKAGSAFYVVHLPVERDLEAFQLVESFPFAELLSAVEKTVPLIQPHTALAEAARQRGLARIFQEGHNTQEGYEIIGKSVADYLLQHHPGLNPKPPESLKPAP